jgi:hypothetical protein
MVVMEQLKSFTFTEITDKLIKIENTLVKLTKDCRNTSKKKRHEAKKS